MAAPFGHPTERSDWEERNGEKANENEEVRNFAICMCEISEARLCHLPRSKSALRRLVIDAKGKLPASWASLEVFIMVVGVAGKNSVC